MKQEAMGHLCEMAIMM